MGKSAQQYVWIVPLALLIIVVGFAVLSGPQFQKQLLEELNTSINKTKTAYNTSASAVIYQIKDLSIGSKIVQYYARNDNPITKTWIANGKVILSSSIFQPESGTRTIRFYLDNLSPNENIVIKIVNFSGHTIDIYINKNYIASINSNENITIGSTFLVKGYNTLTFKLNPPTLPFQEYKTSFYYKIYKLSKKTYQITITNDKAYLQIYGPGTCKVYLNSTLILDGICEFYKKASKGVYTVVPEDLEYITIKVEYPTIRTFYDEFYLEDKDNLYLNAILENTPTEICINNYCKNFDQDIIHLKIPSSAINVGTNLVKIKCLVTDCYVRLLRIERQ